jgi:hypothetical protein
MKSSAAKQVQYRYQDKIFETVNDLDGTHPVPENSNVVILGNGKRYRIILFNITTGAKDQLPFYDVVVEEIG